MSRSAALFRLILLYLFVSGIAMLVYVSYHREPGHLTVAFLDIGQGDSIYIESPTGRQVLIDGGADRNVLSKLSSVMPWFDRSIDVVIGTHPDKDHIGGLPYVLENYDVANIFDDGLNDTTQTYQFFKKEEENEVAHGAHYYVARRGESIDLGGGAVLKILYPEHDMNGVKDTNEASVVAQLIYGSTSVMLTGDAPRDVEDHLVALDGSALHSTILKAGHHGSRTSSDPLFVGDVAPTYAIISAGCHNSYGHPHKETIDTLRAASSTILSTCNSGTIVFESDGTTLTLRR